MSAGSFRWSHWSHITMFYFRGIHLLVPGTRVDPRPQLQGDQRQPSQEPPAEHALLRPAWEAPSPSTSSLRTSCPDTTLTVDSLPWKIRITCSSRSTSVEWRICDFLKKRLGMWFLERNKSPDQVPSYVLWLLHAECDCVSDWVSLVHGGWWGGSWEASHQCSLLYQ